MNKISIGGFTRITKTEARKAYKNGENVYMLPCKVSPVNYWFSPCKMDREARYKTIEENGVISLIEREDVFDCICNEFWLYNCNYNELGKYIAFYVKEEKNNEK